MKLFYFLLPFFLTLISIFKYNDAKGVNAYPGFLTVLQPDGEELKIRIEGDERGHIILTEEGLPVLQNSKGEYVLADFDKEGSLLATNIRASNIYIRERDSSRMKKFDKTDISEKIKTYLTCSQVKREGKGKMTSTFPTLGHQKALVILVEFADRDFSMEDPKNYYSKMLNQEGYSYNGATGSARDYYIENSSGLFLPDFDVYGPVKLSGKTADYGANDRWGDDLHPQLMAIEACRLLDNEIDFTQYDRDSDGQIDNIFFYYAGYGESDGGGPNTIWPHSTRLSLVFQDKFFFDGVELDRYACSNELHSELRDGLPDGIGTFCHEFAHVLGLPDLYATTFINIETPGSWDLMDTGNYNNGGLTPANLSSFERYALDWLSPTPLASSEVELIAIQQSNRAFIFECVDPNEYFLFENRQQNGFDTFLPGHGLLIWHIIYDKKVWESNVLNNYFQNQHVDLIEADAQGGEGTRDSDPFPGSAGKTEFSQKSIPRFAAKSQTEIPYALKNISETSEGVIKFTIEGPPSSGIYDFMEYCETINGKNYEEIYDITGRKINSCNLLPGIYIIRGKKIMVK